MRRNALWLLRYGERAGLVDAHARNVYDEASGWMLAQERRAQ